MKAKEFKAAICRELAVTTINKEPLFSLISEYERETLIKSFYNRFDTVEEALIVIRCKENWTEEE